MVQSADSQELASPALGFSYACASDNFNEFSIEVSSIVGGFNSNNVFVIEMSDGNGSFDKPVLLGQVSDKNNTLNFVISFALVPSTFGENHVIRVRSTSPVTTSPHSNSFAAYYTSNTPLVLENYQDIDLCEGTSTSLTLNETPFTSFNWYKDGAYHTTAGATIQVKKPGLYYAEVDFKICSGGVAVSNLIRVSIIAPLITEILGKESVALCTEDSYELVSSTTAIENNYYWYKDGNLITNISNKESSYTISGANIYGSYFLEIESPVGCVSSSDVVLISNANTEFEVAAVGQVENIIIFPGNSHKLEISTTAPAVSIDWYKDNLLFLNDGPTAIEVTKEGAYKAMVSIPGSPCGAVVSSPVFKVYNPSKYFVSISTPDNYSACISSEVTVAIDKLQYGISSGEKFDFKDFDEGMFTYSWSYNEEDLNSVNTASLLVNDTNKLGAYKLSISDASGVKSISNAVKVNLKLAAVQLKGNEVVYLCAEDSYTFESDVDNAKYKYTWYKNDVKITELPDYTPTYTVSEDVHADYRVSVLTNGGCTTVSNTISLLSASVSFNVIANDASEPIVLFGGATKSLTISTTAINPTIAWFKDGFKIPGSNTLSLSISEPGEYRAKVEVPGTCGQTVYSDYFSVVIPENYELTIQTNSGYSPCDVSTVLLSIKKVVIRISTDHKIVLSPSDYDKFSFKWWYNDLLVSGATESTLLVNDWLKSGKYKLEISTLDGVTAISSELQVDIELPVTDITAENFGGTICKGTNVQLSTTKKEGCTYQWYKDGVSMDGENTFQLSVEEEGSYAVRVIKNACESTSVALEIDYVDEESIEISPSGIIFISQGATKNITASGGQVYEWQNEQGNILSTTDVLNVSKPGMYAVIAQVGDCEIVKIIEVAYKVTTSVPNIISPNDDGVNDTWVLPYGYSFNKEVEIIIYNTNGIVVFRTTNYQNNWPEISVTANTIYYYIIKEKGQILKKGSITVIK